MTTQAAGPTLLLIQNIWGGARGFAFLTCSQVKPEACSGAGFLTRRTNTLIQVLACHGSCPVRCRRFSCVPGLHPRDASSTPHSIARSHDN